VRHTKRGGWPYGQPPNVQFEINWDSQQADGLVLWMPWGGSTPGAHRHVDRVNGLVFTEGGAPVWVADGECGWSLLFNDGNNEYLNLASAVVSVPPFTMTCWFWSDDLTITQCLMSLGSAASTVFHSLEAAGATAGDPIQARTRNTPTAATTTGYSANTWHHACGRWPTTSLREALIDAGSKGTNADLKSIIVSRTSIGALNADAITLPMSGRISDARIYNRALSDTEVYQLYAEPWELYKPLIRRFSGWRSPAPPPVGGHMTLWGRYWGP
jgi:hypothetical protein